MDQNVHFDPIKHFDQLSKLINHFRWVDCGQNLVPPAVILLMVLRVLFASLAGSPEDSRSVFMNKLNLLIRSI